MLRTAFVRSLALIGFAVAISLPSAFGQVNLSELTNALVGKNVVPTVEIGFDATTKNPVTYNGQPARFPVKTQIYPDGHESFRIESGILHTDADKYRAFKDEIRFQITKIEAKNDCLELEMPPLGSDGQPEIKASRKGQVKLMFGKGWQSTMTTDSVLQTIMKYLPTEEMVAKARAEAERVRAEQEEKARIAAEQQRVVAEQARLEEHKKADAQAAERREATEKRIDRSLLAKAKAGDAEAQYQVGKLYSSGTGVDKDPASAFVWFSKSAALGNAKGQNAVGVSYAYGEGIDKDYGQAAIWLRKAADQGNPKAEHNLGDLFYNGWGVSKDLGEALAWYGKSAQHGDSNGEYSLGFMYANGEGTRQDYVQAALWYRKSAALGNGDAENNLGVMYANGQGVTRDYAAAAALYQKAIEHGNSSAKANLDGIKKMRELAAHPPQVTEQDAFLFFQDQVYNYEHWRIYVVDGQFAQYDVNYEMLKYFNNCGSDQKKAMTIALMMINAEVVFTNADGTTEVKKYNGAGLADTAAWEAVRGYRYSEWRFGIEQYFRDDDKLHAAFIKYANWSVQNAGRTTSITRAIADIANVLLRSAYSGQHSTGDFTSFITGYVIPSGEGTPYAAARSASLSLGLK
jgi:TPR repeat protein